MTFKTNMLRSINEKSKDVCIFFNKTTSKTLLKAVYYQHFINLKFSTPLFCNEVANSIANKLQNKHVI